jgi:creatinine amidohydrolase
MTFAIYEQSRPAHLRAAIKEAPVAYVPIGALEWHGEHGPLGLDGLKARRLCELAAERTGGVVFPTVFWGAFDTMPFPFTFHFSKSAFMNQIREILRQLPSWGFTVIVLLTGHYPPSLVRALKRECRHFNRRGGALAIGVPEQAFATDVRYYGDHAGMWETSIMMALMPESIDLRKLPTGLDAAARLTQCGVMGRDPTSKASAEKGATVIEHIVSRLVTSVSTVLQTQNDAAFEAIYAEHAGAMKILSPHAFSLAREALGVGSVYELVRYAIAGARLRLRMMKP